MADSRRATGHGPPGDELGTALFAWEFTSTDKADAAMIELF